MSMNAPARGEVWDIDLDPTKGHEQAGRRPALVISIDRFNQGPAGLVVIVPITSKDKGIKLHVPIAPPGGGLTKHSFAMIEAVRSVSTVRLTKRRGPVPLPVLREVEDRLRVLLGL